MKYLRLIVSAVSLLGVSACREAPRESITVGSDVRAAFLESLSQTNLHRWTKGSVTVTFVGERSTTDVAVALNTLRWLESATGQSLRMSESTTADVEIHVAKKSEWGSILGDGGGRDVASGVTHAEWGSDGSMKHAIVVVDAEADQASRNRTIVHELHHAMGFAHHMCAGALAFGGGDTNPAWEPSPFDVRLAQLLYDGRLRVGDSQATAGGVLVENGNAEPCPALGWEMVRTEDTKTGAEGSRSGLWCKSEVEPRRCVLPDASRGPVDGLETVAWLANQTVYDYNPDQYVTFSLKGVRVLCELPTAHARGRCQRTNGRTVDVADLYTDGVGLYEQPA